MRSKAKMYTMDWICVRYYARKMRTGNRYCLLEEYKHRQTKQWGKTNTTAVVEEAKPGAKQKMTVESFYGTGRPKTYTLEHWDKDQKCFILSINNTNGNVKCELHQWAVNINVGRSNRYAKSDGYHACEMKFNEICPFTQHSVLVYDREECKEIIPTSS
uniref:Lipocalin n=1 Tax=Amblyomma maculatum TaxID=34609 RepID=G3MTW6_AMBMU